jgi:hypothetical protein
LEDRTILVWPSAFAYDSFDAIPRADLDVLEPLYDESDFASWEEFGGYIGYRVGIDAETGEWLFFVAGD